MMRALITQTLDKHVFKDGASLKAVNVKAGLGGNCTGKYIKLLWLQVIPFMAFVRCPNKQGPAQSAYTKAHLQALLLVKSDVLLADVLKGIGMRAPEETLPALALPLLQSVPQVRVET